MIKLKESAFGQVHPAVNFLYFTLVLLCSMFFMHPLCLTISFVCAFTYSVMLGGKKALRFNLLMLLPMMAVAALINPAFNHEGQTILTYLPDGNPLTLESIVYGLAAAAMLAAVLCWFSCYNAVMTSDKFIYLFGRVIPALSLILSMVLRFVPKFKAQLQVISQGQKCIGRDISEGNLFRRMQHGIKILSIMVTWALENAIETADSMKSRGYGLPGRTAFSIFRFDSRDQKLLAVICSLGLCVLLGGLFGRCAWRYFPDMAGVVPSFSSVLVFCAYFILCSLPQAMELWEARRWKRLQSSI